MTKALWFGAAALFVMAELLVIVAFRRTPSNQSGFWLTVSHVAAVLWVAFPLIAGVSGYSSAKRRLSSADGNASSVLSSQFLMTVIVAYVAIVACIGPLLK